jgi:catechol 2,3-dioxygenase-like lactoylglutathione lyase family enzyme
VADANALSALKRRLDRSGTNYSAVELAGFAPGALEFSDPDGNKLIFGVAQTSEQRRTDATANRAARMQHIVFASTNVHRLLEFYTDVVGFVLSDRVVDDKGGLRTIFLRCSHDHHSVAVFAASENRIDHHCYEAGDWNLIRDWSDHFARLHVPLKWGPGRHGPGDNLFVFVHDPDGNWVEISAELEQVEPDRPVGDWPHEERTLNSWGIGLLRS